MHLNRSITKSTILGLLTLVVSITSYWFWRITKYSFLIAVFVLLVGVIYAFLDTRRTIKVKHYILFGLLITAFSVVVLSNSFDKNLLITNRLEKDTLERRYHYYAEGVGRVYRNRLGIYYHYNISPLKYKFSRNLYESLDVNLYFFGNHPRERGRVSEFNKFSFILTPFFLMGMYKIIVEKKVINLILILFTVVVSALIKADYILGPVLYLPFISFATGKGIYFFCSELKARISNEK